MTEKKKPNKNQYKHILIGEFQRHLKAKGLDPKLNKYAEQYAAQALIDSYTLEGCYELMEYYFNVSLTPSWVWFKNNADKIYKAKHIRDEDYRVRSFMRQQARDWLS